MRAWQEMTSRACKCFYYYQWHTADCTMWMMQCGRAKWRSVQLCVENRNIRLGRSWGCAERAVGTCPAGPQRAYRKRLILPRRSRNISSFCLQRPYISSALMKWREANGHAPSNTLALNVRKAVITRYEAGCPAVEW